MRILNKCEKFENIICFFLSPEILILSIGLPEKVRDIFLKTHINSERTSLSSVMLSVVTMICPSIIDLSTDTMYIHIIGSWYYTMLYKFDYEQTIS